MLAKLITYLDQIQPPALDFSTLELGEAGVEVDHFGMENAQLIVTKIIEKIADPEFVTFNFSKLHFEGGMRYFALLSKLAEYKKTPLAYSSLPRVPIAHLTTTDLLYNISLLSKLTTSFKVKLNTGFWFGLNDFLAAIKLMMNKPIRYLRLPNYVDLSHPQVKNALINFFSKSTMLEELNFAQTYYVSSTGDDFLGLKKISTLKRLTVPALPMVPNNIRDLPRFLQNLPNIKVLNLKYLTLINFKETVQPAFAWLHQQENLHVVIFNFESLIGLEKIFGEFLAHPEPAKNLSKIYLVNFHKLKDVSSFYKDYISRSHYSIFAKNEHGTWQRINFPQSFFVHNPTQLLTSLPNNTYPKVLPSAVLGMIERYSQHANDIDDEHIIKCKKIMTLFVNLKSELERLGQSITARSSCRFFSRQTTLINQALAIINAPKDLLHYEDALIELEALFSIHDDPDWITALQRLAISRSHIAKFSAMANDIRTLNHTLNQETPAPL